jgi:hypothetical protein
MTYTRNQCLPACFHFINHCVYKIKIYFQVLPIKLERDVDAHNLKVQSLRKKPAWLREIARNVL